MEKENRQIKVTRKEHLFEKLERESNTRRELKESNQKGNLFLFNLETLVFPSLAKLVKIGVLVFIVSIIINVMNVGSNIGDLTNNNNLEKLLPTSIQESIVGETVPTTTSDKYKEAMDFIDANPISCNFSVEEKDALAKEYIKLQYNIDLN